MKPFFLLKRTPLIGSLLLIIGLWAIAVLPITANDIPSQPDTTTIPYDSIFPLEMDVSADAIGWCPSNANICRINRQWTIEEIKAGLDGNNWAIWEDNQQLVFAFRGHVADAMVIGGIQVALAPINNSDYWVATLHVSSLSRAVISYSFVTYAYNQWQLVDGSSQVFRGDRAPDAPDFAVELKGYYDTEVFYSAELDELRLVSYYLPPNFSFRETYPVLYMTDGQALDWFARTVEPLIAKRLIPPMIMVGVHAPYAEPTRQRRAEEYILGLNDEAYLAHEQFFTESVRRWSELRLGASTDPNDRMIMGFSNGAAFAGNTAVRKPDTYGHVILFSQSHHPLINLRSQVKARFYLSAGTLEPEFHSQAQRFHFTLRLLNVDTIFRQRVSGHDYLVWQEELPNALQWIFAD